MSSSVSFYSTKAKRNVSIPTDKVCGYRIANDIMKDGYSDGLKSGANNGVVNQRLSRFSTQEEREKSSNSCDGNTNWLNYKRGQNFNKPESADKKFSIDRPMFKAGSFDHERKPAESIDHINIRNGRGNQLIERDNFLAPDIQSRRVPLFATMEAMTVSEAGTIVGSLYGSKLSEKAKIRLPDPTDFEWLRERDRMNAVLTREYRALLKPDGSRLFTDAEVKSFVDKDIEINKPLGRDQRIIYKTTDDIANSTLNANKKVDEISQEVREGRAESMAGQRGITAQLVQVLADVANVAQLSEDNLYNIGLIIPRLGIPTDYRQMGLASRFIDNEAYIANPGMINLLLLSKVRAMPQGPITYDMPVINNITGNPARLVSVERELRDRRNPMFLDLKESLLLSFARLKQNWASGLFQPIDFDLSAANLAAIQRP